VPKLHLTSKDKSLIVAGAVFLSAVAAAGWWFLGNAAVTLTVIVAAVVVLVVIVETYRRLANIQVANLARADTVENNQRLHYEQIESLLSLLFTIQPKYPLPKTRGFAASPDFLRQVYELIQDERPRLVVEAGSGASTLIAAFSLRQVGRGKVVSLEHDSEYVRATKSIIARHGLQDISTVLHAPLTEHDIRGRSWQWYDLTGLGVDEPVDLLLIDGPPGSIQKLARYPALPLLFSRLSDNATIILDDGSRTDEKETVELWLREFGQLSCEFVPLEKGCYVIHRTQHPPAPQRPQIS
jgi:predicted O-methyltransferase YrrM